MFRGTRLQHTVKISAKILMFLGVFSFVLGTFYNPNSYITPVKTAKAAYTGKHLRTVEYLLGATGGTGSDSTVRGDNVTAYAGTAWGTTNNNNYKNVVIKGTGILVKNAYLDISFETSTTADNVVGIKTTLDVEGGPAAGTNVEVGNDTSVITQSDSGQDGYVMSRHDVTALFDRQSDTTWNNGVDVEAGVTVDFSSTANRVLTTAKLIITYEQDYSTTSHTETKTVRFPLDSTNGSDNGTRAAACAASTTCGFAYTADIPDATADGDIVDVWYDMYFEYDGGTASTTVQPQISGGTAGPSYGTQGIIAGDENYHFSFRPTVGGSNFLRSTAQTLNIVNGTQGLNVLGGELVVTYNFSTGAATQTETVRYFLDQDTTAPGTSASAFPATSVTISNTGASMKNIWMKVEAPVAAAQTWTVSGTVGAASARATGYAYTGVNARAGKSATVIHDLSLDVASFSFPSTTINGSTTYSSATGDVPHSAEVFLTFTWSGSGGGTVTKTVTYGQGHLGTQTLASYWHNGPLSVALPETVTKTHRSTYLVTDVNHSEATNIALGTTQIGVGATTTSVTEYDDLESIAYTLRHSINNTMFSGGATISWAQRTFQLNHTSSAADEYGFSSQMVITYDAALSENGTTPGGKHLRTVEYLLGATGGTGSDSTVRGDNVTAYAGTAWGTTNNNNYKNVVIKGTGILVKNAYLDISFETSTTADNVVGIKTTLDVEGGPAAGTNVEVGNDTSVITQSDSGQDGYVMSRHDVTALFDRQSDTTWNNGVDVEAGVTVDFSSTANRVLTTAKLIITYEQDYSTTSHTETKTVRFPLDSTNGSDNGTRAAACAASTTCGFAYTADIPDATADGDIVDVWYDMYFEYDGGTASTTVQPQISGGTAGPSYGTQGIIAGDENYHFSFRPTVGGSNFLRSTAQTLNIVNGTQGLNVLGGELVVTYNFSTGAATQTETVRYFLDQDTTAPGTSASAFPATSVTISNTGASMKNIWMKVEAPVAAAQTWTVSGTVGAASARATGYAYTGVNARAGKSATVIHDLSLDVASFSFPSTTINGSTTYSSATGDVPHSAEVFLTFTWSGSGGGTVTKTVTYGQGHLGTQTLASYWHNGPLSVALPETVTKTHRSTYLVTDVNHSEATNIALGTTQIGVGATTTSVTEYDDLESIAYTLRHSINNTMFSGGATISWAQRTFQLNHTSSAADEYGFSSQMVITYDAALAASGGGGVTISGTTVTNDETTSDTTAYTVRLSVAGGTSTTTASSGGAFSFSSITVSTGQFVTMWLDTAGGNRGTTVFKYGASCAGTPNCTGLKIVRDQVRLENFNTGNITTTDLAAMDNDTGGGTSGDTDIGFTANSGILTVSTNWELKINTGATYAPGGTVTTPKLDVAGTYTGASETLTLNGSGTSTTCTASTQMPLCVTGTYTPPTNTNFTGTSASTIENTSYTNIYFGGTTTTYTLDTGTFTITGNFLVEDLLSIVINASTNNPTINITGSFTLNDLNTFQSTSGVLSISGDLQFGNPNNSVFTHNSGTVRLTATDSGNLIATGGDSFYNLILDGSGGVWSPTASDINVANDLTITNGTLNNSAGSGGAGLRDVTVNGNVQCGATCGTIALTIDTFTQSVTVDKNFGTNVAVGTAWSFNNLTFTGTTDIITTSSTGTGTITVAGTLTISASTTLNLGTRTWILTGATPLTVTGTFTAPSTSITRFTYSGGILTIPRLTYGTLELKPGGTQTHRLEGGGTLNILGDFVCGNATNVTTCDVNTNDPTVDVNGNVTIAANGTLQASDSASFTIGGGWTTDGTFTHNNGTITFDGSSGNINQGINGFSCANAPYNIVLINASGAWTNNMPMCLFNSLTISSGTLSGGGNIYMAGSSMSGAGTISLSSQLTITGGTDVNNTGNWSFAQLIIGDTDSGVNDFSGSGTFTVTDTFTVQTGHTFNAGGKTFILSDSTGCPCTPLANSGTFNADTSTFRFTGNGATTIARVTYNNLESKPAGSVTHSLEGGGTFTVGGYLEIGTGSNASILNVDTNDPTLDVNGSVTINASATFIASATNDMTVAGNWTNSGTFTASGRTVTFDTTTTTVFIGNTTFYSLTAATSGKTIEIDTGTTITTTAGGVLTLTGVAITRQTGDSGSWTINHQGTESVTNTTVSWSACHGSSTEITALTSSGNVDGGNNGTCWTFNLGITITGFAYDDEATGDLTICNGSTQNISVKVGSQSVANTTCADSGNAFTFNGVTAPSTGDAITVFINTDGTTVGAAVTRYDGTGNVTGFIIRKNRLIVTSDNATAVTNTHLDNYDNDTNAEDMPFVVTGGNLTLEDGIKLIVKETATTTFQPGGTITTSVSNDGADSIVNGDVSVEASAVLNMESNNLSIGGDLSNSGTLTYSAGQTTTFTATASGHTIADNTSNFHHLTFNGTNGDWSMTSAVVLGGALTVTAGTLSGTQDMTVTTDATGAGTINLTGGTFEQRVGASEDFGTTSGSNNWTFNNLTFSRSAGTPTITTQTGGSGTIAITGTLKISKTGDGAATTLDAGNRTWILSNSNLAKPFTLDEASGVLTPNSSTFNFTGDNDGGDVTLENTTYNHLQIGGATAENYTPEGAIILNGDFTTNSSGTLNGAQNITVNGGDVSGAGGINLSGGLFTLSGTPGANFGSAANWVFDSLTIGGATNTTYTATGAGSITVNETLTIDGSDTLNGGTSKTFILTDADSCPCTPFVATGAFTANGSTFEFTGNAATTIPRVTYWDLKSSPAGAVTHTLAGGGTFTVGNDLTIGTGSNASILNASTSDPIIDINGDLTINASATLTASDLNDMTVAGGWVNSGAFTHNSRTVTLDGSGAGNTLNAGGTGQPFNILTISGSGSWTVSGTAMQVSGDLTVNTGTLNGSQNVTVLGGDLTGTGTINMSGGVFTLSGTPGADFGSTTNWIFDSLTIGGATNTTYTATGSGTFTVNETLTIDGSDTLNGGSSKVWILADADGCPCTPFVATGSFTPNGSTFRYSGIGPTNIAGQANSGTITYNVLESVPAGTVTHTLGTAASQTIVVNDNFTVGDGINSSTIHFDTNDPVVTVKGNVWLKAEAIWTRSNTSALTLSPTGTKTFTDSNTTKQDLGIISITGGTATPKIQAASSFKATSIAIAASHEFDIQTNTLTLTGNGATVLDKNASGTFTVGTGSTVDFTSTSTSGTTVPSLNFHHLTLNRASNTFTMSSGSPTLGGNLTITAGTLDLDTSDPTLTVTGNIIFAGTLTPSGSSSLTVRGNFTNNGTFTDIAGSTVVVSPFGTTSTIAGSNATTFRNLTASNQGGKTLQFKANTTTVISGVLTLSGVSGDVLWVKSDSANNQWTLSITGSAPSIDYVIFQDTACHGGTTSVLLGQHVFDAGNNGLCFNFIKRGSSVGASDGSTGGGSGQTGGGQGGGGGGGGGGGEGQGGGGGGGGGGGSP